MSRIAIVAILAAALLCGGAWAQSPMAPADTDIGKSDPPGKWRVMNRKKATSRCIGDTRTPICAMETEIACIVGRGDRFCELIFDGYSVGKAPRETDPPRTRYYRVLGVAWAPDDADPLEQDERGRDPATPKDIFVRVREYDCSRIGCTRIDDLFYRYRRRSWGLWESP